MGYMRHSLKEQAKRKRFQHWHHQPNVKWENNFPGVSNNKNKSLYLKSVVVGIDAVTVWAGTLTVDEDLNLDLITNGKKKLSLPLVVQVLPRAETGKH